MADPRDQRDRQLEREQKFDLGADATRPGLGALLTPGQTRVQHLRAVYLDTPDLLLVRHRITLRRREGGHDEGWHLKLPADEETARWELHAPLTRGPGRWRLPPGHLAALAERLGPLWTTRPHPARGLVPVTTLGTTRTEVELLDRDGRAVAVLCDDLVRVEPGRRRWRELEVELIGDGPGPAVRDGADLLAKVTRCFAAQGVHPASSPSKLSRALGDRPARAERGLGPGRQDPAADVVLTYLAEQVAAIRGWEDGLRSDAEGAVHKARVACRRSRSALRTFRRLLDRQVSDPLRQEIRWFAGVLGGPRDAEVQQARLLQQLAALPKDEVVGPVQERIRAELDRRHTQQLAALHRALDGPRYAALVDALTELVAYPPWRARASRTAQEVLPPLVDSAVDRARADWDRARATEGEERLRLLHETRKSAKAVRYAWEALAPAFGEPAAQQARDWERVTEQLGAAQDAVVATARLRELLAAARLAEEPTATYVLLLRRELGEQERAAAAGAQLVAHLLDH